MSMYPVVGLTYVYYHFLLCRRMQQAPIFLLHRYVARFWSTLRSLRLCQSTSTSLALSRVARHAGWHAGILHPCRPGRGPRCPAPLRAECRWQTVSRGGRWVPPCRPYSASSMPLFGRWRGLRFDFRRRLRCEGLLLLLECARRRAREAGAPEVFSRRGVITESDTLSTMSG